MRKLCKGICILITLVLALSMFAGCNKQQKAGSQQTNMELRFGWWGGDSRHEAYLAAINKYMELNPQVKIIAEYGGWDGYKEKLYTQLAGGNAPHIFQNHFTWLPEQAAWEGRKVIKDLNEYKGIIDFDIFPEGFLEKYVIFNNELLALPSSLNADAIVGNKKLFAEAGIDYNKDWTFEDFFTANKKLKKVNPQYYFENGMSARDIHMYWFLAFMVQKTGLPYTTDYQLSYDKKTVQEAFAFIKRYFDEGVVEPLGTLELYAGKYSQNPKWINGQAAISFGMLSTLETAVKALGDHSDEAVVIKLPVLKDAKDPYYQIKCGQIFSLPASVKGAEAEEAVKFINWSITSKEAALELKLSRGIPISEVQKKALVDAGQISPLIIQAEKYARDIGQGIGQDVLIRNNEIAAIGADIISQVAFGIKTPEQAAEEYINLVNKKLAELKARLGR